MSNKITATEASTSKMATTQISHWEQYISNRGIWKMTAVSWNILYEHEHLPADYHAIRNQQHNVSVFQMSNWACFRTSTTMIRHKWTKYNLVHHVTSIQPITLSNLPYHSNYSCVNTGTRAARIAVGSEYGVRYVRDASFKQPIRKQYPDDWGRHPVE